MAKIVQTLSNLHSLNILLGDTGKATSKTGKKFIEFGQVTLKLASSMKLLSEALKINVTVSKQFATLYEKETKILGQFQDSVYKGAHALRTANGAFKTIKDSQEAYKKQIDEMRKDSILTRQQATEMYGSIVEGMKGIRTKEFVNEITKIGKAFISLEGDVDKGKAALESLMGVMNKYQSMRDIGLRAAEGKMTRDDELRIQYMYSKGEINLEQARKFSDMGAYREMIPTGTHVGGREAAMGQRETEKLAIDAEHFTAASEAVKSFAEASRKAADTINKFTQQHSEGFGSALAISKSFGMAALVTGIAGTAAIGLGKFFLGGKGGGKGGGILSKLGSGLGAAGGDARGIKVWVSNMPGTGLTSAFNAAGAGTGVKGAAATIATRGLFSKVFGLTKSIVGLGAILAPLIVGYRESQDKENENLSSAQKSNAGWIKGGITAAGTAAGFALGGPFGAAVGAAAGSVIGEVATDFIYEKDRKPGEKEKEINELTKAEDKGIKSTIKLNEGLGELSKREMELADNAQIYRNSIDSLSEFVSALDGLIGTGKKGAEALNALADVSVKEQKIYEDIKDFHSKQAQEAGISNKRRMEQETLAREAENKINKARKEEIEARTKASEMETKQNLEMATANTSYYKSEKELHAIKRMGMGVSYDDTVKNIQALANEVALSQKLYKDRLKLAKQSQDDPVKYATYMKEATQLRAESIQKETELYSEAKGMREGYLDAFRSEMSATGGYAELFPTRDSGIQNFAKSLALGGTGVAGVDTPGKYTTAGVKFDKEGQERVADVLLDTKSFIIGQSDLQGVLMEQGIGIDVEQLDVGKEQLKTQKALLQATERASGIRPNASSGGVISATGAAAAGSATGAGTTGSIAAAGSATGSSTKQTLKEAFFSGKINIDEYRNERLERARLAAKYSGEIKRNPFGDEAPKMDAYAKLKKEKNYREDRRFQERMNDWNLKEVGGKIITEKYDEESMARRKKTTEKWEGYKSGEELKEFLRRIAEATEKAITGATGGVYG